MSLAASITTLLTFVLLTLVVPMDDEIKGVLRTIMLTAVGLSGWLQLKLLIQLQRQRGRDHPHPLRRTTDVP